MTFANPLTILVASLMGFGAPLQASLQEKLQALQEPVCVLPYGQTIGLDELPTTDKKWDHWMKRLPGNLPISLVSIPATHDAGTARGRTGWTRCQVLTIPAQLALGVRGFDIRLRLVDDRLMIYHNEESQSLAFDEVMNAFRKFLSSNPDEFLVMRIREESKALRSTRSFGAAFESVAHSTRYASLFFPATSRKQIPLVSQVRGKIVLLDNYGKLNAAIEYPNPSMSVQDDYDTADMAKKFSEIVLEFESAAHEKSGAVWHVNYTSSSTATFDQLANAKAINAKVQGYLVHAPGRHLGLVFMNFPGVDLIREVIESN